MEKYSDNLLDEKFTNIGEKMDDHFEALSGVLGEIKKQTTTTNGRVSKLERWQQFVLGGWAVFSLIVVPLLYWLGSEVTELRSRLDKVETTIDL